eukprot:m.415565 g.415565  ORF g.415565 m.415565 type:complete len:306 (+) comp29674_c0_seq1:53-970(+)
MSSKHVRETDFVSDWVQESQGVGATLSRRNPKIKQQFEARKKVLDTELAKLKDLQAKTRAPSVAAGRIDPRWRLTEDTARIKGAQPFILIEQGFNAIINGAEDLALKTKKLGTTPIAVTFCVTAFEQLMQTFLAYMDETLFAGIDHARAKSTKEYVVPTALLRDTAKMLEAYGYSVREDLAIAAKGGSAGHEKVDTLQDVMPAFIAEMLALLEATKEAILPIAHLIGDGQADQVAFLAECLGSTGALSGTTIVTYVLSKSGIDKEVDDAQEYVDSLKLVSGADGIQALIPQMKKALKLSGDKISW